MIKISLVWNSSLTEHSVFYLIHFAVLDDYLVPVGKSLCVRKELSKQQGNQPQGWTMSTHRPSRKESLGNAELSIMVSQVKPSLNWVEMLHRILTNSLYSDSQVPINYLTAWFPCIMPLRHCWNKYTWAQLCVSVGNKSIFNAHKNWVSVLAELRRPPVALTSTRQVPLTGSHKGSRSPAGGTSPDCTTASWGCFRF